MKHQIHASPRSCTGTVSTGAAVPRRGAPRLSLLKALAPAMLFVLSCPATAQTVILDTFWESNQSELFACCQSYNISTKDSFFGELQAVGLPFTVPVDGKIGAVDIALSWFEGKTDKLEVEVHLDANGLPGRLDGDRRSATHIPGVGQCCVYESVHFKDVVVRGGRQYWLVVKALGDRFGAWNYNAYGAFGPLAELGPDRKTWTTFESSLPAVRIWMKSE